MARKPVEDDFPIKLDLARILEIEHNLNGTEITEKQIKKIAKKIKGYNGVKDKYRTDEYTNFLCSVHYKTPNNEVAIILPRFSSEREYSAVVSAYGKNHNDNSRIEEIVHEFAKRTKRRKILQLFS